MRPGRGAEARDRQFSLRPAGSRTVEARQGGRLHRDVVGDHRAGGDLARGERRRRHHRARRRSRRPSRHVPDREYRRAARHLCAGAAGGGCREGAGDRGRRHRRRARHRGGVRAGGGGRADRHRLSALSGIQGDRAGARGAGAGPRRFHRHHQCHDRASGARGRQPGDARGRPDFAGCPGISPFRYRARAAEGGCRKARQGRFHQSLGRAGGAARPRNAGRGADPGAGRRRPGAAEPMAG